MEQKRTSKTMRFVSLSVTLKRQFLAALVIISILLNGFIPRFALNQDDFNVLNQIIEQQSTLLKFFSLSTIPLNIVYELFAEKENLSNTVSDKASEKNKENKTNTSSDFSIISIQRNITAGKSISTMRR